MRRFAFKMLTFLFLFGMGVAVDYELRHNRRGITDCSCMSFKCRFVTFADNPSILATHPIESIAMILSITFYD